MSPDAMANMFVDNSSSKSQLNRRTTVSPSAVTGCISVNQNVWTDDRPVHALLDWQEDTPPSHGQTTRRDTISPINALGLSMSDDGMITPHKAQTPPSSNKEHLTGRIVMSEIENLPGTDFTFVKASKKIEEFEVIRQCTPLTAESSSKNRTCSEVV